MNDRVQAILADLCRGGGATDRVLRIAACCDRVADAADRLADIALRMAGTDPQSPEWERLREESAQVNAGVDAMVQAEGEPARAALLLLDFLDQQGGHLRLRLSRRLVLLESERPDGWARKAEGLQLVRMRVHGVWAGAHARVLARLLRNAVLVACGLAAKQTGEDDVDRLSARQDRAEAVPFITVERLEAAA